MADGTRTGRRREALSKARIVEAAVDILDRAGEDALTFRALARHLATGSGAIYWHVTDKNDLLAAAADQVVARVMAEAARGSSPKDAIRTMADGLFDAIHTHPWIGAQLSRNPWQSAVLRIMEGIGSQVQALGFPDHAQFNVVTALLSFILGLADQYAARARFFPPDTDRAAFRKAQLGAVAAKWMELDPAAYPFVRQIAGALPEHDDREQFLAGIDLILAGMDSIPHRRQ